MVNLELYNIATSCTSESSYMDVDFDNDAVINKYDVLEYTSGGYFVNIKSRNIRLWPKIDNDLFRDSSLYIIESLTRNDDSVTATLIHWSFGAPTILGESDQEYDIVVTENLLERLPKNLYVKKTEQLIEWLNTEFLFKLNNGQSVFLRIINGNNGLDGSWLGRNWIAIINEKKITNRNGTQNCFVIEGFKKSPQKALNIQKGIANINFVSEKDAIEASPIFKAQFALSSSDPSSIINLWKKYNDIDEKFLLEQQETSGILRADKITKRNDGKIYATIQNSSENIEKFKNVYEALKEDYYISVSSSSNKRDLPIKNVYFNSEQRTMLWDWAEKDKMPHEKLNNALIKIDFKPWAVQAKRRKEALEAIRSRNIPIPAITDLLNESAPFTFSSTQPKRIPSDIILRKAFGNNEPNEAQLRALKICLSSPDIALIQGPPGTGKTSVIRALQNVLQSEDAKHKKAVPSILLTSFQHVAVDNVATGSKIWGLPVFRFYGAKKDKEQIFEGLKSWQEETAKVVDKQIENLKVDDKYNDYEHIIFMLHCVKDAENAYEIRSLLSEILTLAKKDSFLSTDEILDIQQWKKNFSASEKNDTFYKLLMGIRITPTSFEDDGAANIKKLLDYYDLRKEFLNCPTLEQEYDHIKSFIVSIPSKEDYDWLNEFRNKSINQTNSNSIRSSDKTLFRALQKYIEKTLIPNIEERIKHNDIHLMQILNEYRKSVEFKSIRNAMMKYAVTFAATTQQSKSDAFVNLLGDENFGFDYVIVDEAARANPLDLFIPITLARKKVILVGDHKQLPQLVDQDILEQMQQSDDEKLPDNLQQYMDKSLFEALWNYLKTDCNDGINRTVTLDCQYRMPQKLGDFISTNFYGDNKIKTGKKSNDCIHFSSRYKKRNGECMCAAWEDVDGKESGRTSKENRAEAERIITRLKELIQETKESIGVIASYSAQVKLIEQMAKEDLNLSEAIKQKQLEIGSIDAFQGKQFDIVFFSVVRNNNQGIFGFLTMNNRLNVAFSRQKKLLVVVGSRKMFSTSKACEKVSALNAFISLADSEV